MKYLKALALNSVVALGAISLIASPAIAGCGGCEGSHSKGGYEKKASHGPVADLKEAASLLKSSHPELSGRLSDLAKHMHHKKSHGDGHGHGHGSHSH